jgi:SpoIIAA-like
MIEQIPLDSEQTLGFTMSGKLHDEDYKKFVPSIDAAIARHGKIRLLAVFHDFHGWDLHALWDDIKFSTTHCTKIDRIALLGKKHGRSGWRRCASRSPWPRFTTSRRERSKRRKIGWRSSSPVNRDWPTHSSRRVDGGAMNMAAFTGIMMDKRLAL